MTSSSAITVHGYCILKNKKIFLYIDGASRGNPGPAGVGVLMLDESRKKIKEFYRYIGETTNNIAEYNALIYGLEEATKLNADEIVINLDSELVAKQLSGDYRVKDSFIKPLFEKALGILRGFGEFKIKHIDRSENKAADKLANKAINLKQTG
ncbi:MAG: ribonuclease HI family protein [Candidatus Omnitrophica bacterium]|nr:ribonuclease HI family protein [Candidatus Omnitrophota bacterium]